MNSNVHALEGARPVRSEIGRPSRAEVEAAFRTVIRWTGDDPYREGLIETPARMARAFEEFFVGYAHDPVEILQKTFEQIDGYNEMIVLGVSASRVIASITWHLSSAKPGSLTFRLAVWLALANSRAWSRLTPNASRYRKR